MQTRPRDSVAAPQQHWKSIVVGLMGLVLWSSTASSGTPLSERERTFLRLVFNGEEAKAIEYAEVAGINVNAIAGQSLGSWFYQDGRSKYDRVELRNTDLQRIVFERFKQNPNAPVGETNSLGMFCSYAPFQQNLQLESVGTPDQIKALRDQQESQRRPHIEAMGAGFESLLRYGLTDKHVINAIFQGCVYRSAAPVNVFFYDTVLAKMVRAGANINAEAEDGSRPIRAAVERFSDPVLVERMIRDGAQVNYLHRQNAFDKPTPQEPCSPRASHSLYGYVFDAVRPRNPDALVAMVRALATGGLSPLTKYGQLSKNGDGTVQCRYSSFHDAVIDTGNLDLARRIKDVTVVSPVASKSQAVLAPPALPPASPPVPVDAKPPERIGAWQISSDNGRLVAIARAEKGSNNGFASLRLECVGGKLEYVPVALKLIGPMTSLWISVAGDAKEMKLVNQRASGLSANMLSNEFAANEPKGTNQPWGIEMTVQSWNEVGDNVVMTGFSQMRAFMRANCKN